jgi:hypothetical protein
MVPRCKDELEIIRRALAPALKLRSRWVGSLHGHCNSYGVALGKNAEYLPVVAMYLRGES